MDEFINALDNFTLFKLFGGLGLVLSAVIIFCSKLFNERIAQKWKESSNQRIEQLKGIIEKNNTVVATLTQQIGQNFQKVLEKRIEATDLYWQNILKMRAAIPATAHLCYQILLDEELNNETLDNDGSGLGSQLSEFSLAAFTNELTKSLDEINRTRPFLSENLAVFMYAYQGFIGRTIFLLINGYEQHNIIKWKDDAGVLQILRTVLVEEELDYIYRMKMYSYDSVLQLLEIKILEEIRRHISSEDMTMNSLTELKKINQIIEQKTQPTRNR